MAGLTNLEGVEGVYLYVYSIREVCSEAIFKMGIRDYCMITSIAAMMLDGQTKKYIL